MSSSPTVVQASDVRAPSGTAPRLEQRIADTGTTEDHNATALTAGEMATLLNGSEPIRVSHAGAAALADQVATTDLVIGPYGRLDWLVQADTDDHVYAEAADGAAAYECWVWTSSGPRV